MDLPGHHAVLSQVSQVAIQIQYNEKMVAYTADPWQKGITDNFVKIELLALKGSAWHHLPMEWENTSVSKSKPLTPVEKSAIPNSLSFVMAMFV